MNTLVIVSILVAAALADAALVPFPNYRFGSQPYYRPRTFNQVPFNQYPVVKAYPNNYYGQHVPILRSDSSVQPDGSYYYAYETANGITAQEQGQQSVPNGGTQARGGFKYTSPEGKKIELSYIADEKGFRPVSSELPVGPDIPSYIRRSLEYNAAHPNEENASS